MHPSVVVLGFLTLFAFGQAQAQTPAPVPKKLIYYGWGSPDTQYVREHWQEMEQIPFDGVGIVVAVDRQAWQQGKHDTGNQLGWQAMGRRAFQPEEFRDAITDLMTAQWHTMTNNFLPIMLSAEQSAAGLNWFDDGRWRTITHNFTVLARIAAEGQLKGFILDPEHYNYALFSYVQQRQQKDKPFQEYVQAARQRGREVMTAVVAILPKPVLLSLYGHSQPLPYLRQDKTLPDVAYSLLPAFYDGLLEAMPADSQLIDGYEFAYAFKERRQFLKGYQQIHQEALKFSAVPDRYRQQVKAGFGLWLDYRRQPNYFTPEEFQRAVSAALEVSDGYVWIYTQGPRFFPPSAIDAAYLEAMAAARREVKR
jgi:hypothetical protein